MAYNGNRPKNEAKIVAYGLSKEFGASQKAIAGVFNTSQSVISSWIKEVSYERKITDLSQQIQDQRAEIQRLGKELNLAQEAVLIEYIPDYEYEDDEYEEKK